MLLIVWLGMTHSKKYRQCIDPADPRHPVGVMGLALLFGRCEVEA